MTYLLIILLIILAWRFYQYVLLPVNNIRSRMNDAQTRYQHQQQQYRTHRREGETEIEYVPQEESNRTTDRSQAESGEYIDYEEVK